MDLLTPPVCLQRLLCMLQALVEKASLVEQARMLLVPGSQPLVKHLDGKPGQIVSMLLSSGACSCSLNIAGNEVAEHTHAAAWHPNAADLWDEHT